MYLLLVGGCLKDEAKHEEYNASDVERGPELGLVRRGRNGGRVEDDGWEGDNPDPENLSG